MDKSFTRADKIALFITFSILSVFFFSLWGKEKDSLINQAREKARRFACQKNLKDFFMIVTAYSNMAEEEGGGDGEFPYVENAKSPEPAFHLLIRAGLVTDPKRFKCPAAWGPVAKTNPNFNHKKPKPWKIQNLPFILTQWTCYYDYTSQRVNCDDEDPNAVLIGDRWIRYQDKARK
ncbi:MAG: hypothetical protein D6785_14065, partial [Planctomycetota bacterium]